MRVIVTPLAARDYADIEEHISAENPKAAIRVLRAIRTRIHRLRTFPESGQPVPGFADLRRVVCGPYLIFYAVRNNTIAVARILHGARDIETILHPHRIIDPDA
jgi:toxin ParE1/3/4